MARIDAVAVKSGAIDDKMKKLKYHGKEGWAAIFGRLLLGHLDRYRNLGEFDLIVANPTYVGDDATRSVRHTELVIEAAETEDVFGVWPFDIASPRAVVKVAETRKSAVGGSNFATKVAAANELPSAVEIPDVRRTDGARILIYDDVCTTGYQLDRLAGVLRRRGSAEHVEALVLARTPFRTR